MAEDKPNIWNRLPKPKFNKNKISKQMRKVEGATIRHAHKFVVKRWDNVLDVQRHIVAWILVMGVLIAATGLQLMWYQKNYTTTTLANDTTYSEAVLGPVKTLNPLFADSSAEQSASYLMFSRLLKYDTTGHLNYDIAKNIKIDETKKIYTVTIRSDVKWHDGEKLTANDIDFTLNLMKNPNTRTADASWANINTKVINDTTIEFTLQSTYAAFEHALTFPIIPKHILKDIDPANVRENSFSQKPIGSGPFKFSILQDVNIKSGSKVIYMVRNDDYYREVSKLVRFQLHVYDSTDSIVSALSSNEVNSATGLSSIDIERINKKHYKVSTNPIQSGVYALLNTKSEILKDIAIRRALQIGTNTAAVREKLSKGTPALWLPITPNQITGEVPVEPKYDQAIAKNMIDEMGWKLGDKNVRFKEGKELKLSVVTVKNSEFERVLEILSGQWRSLGVNIETKVIDPADFSQAAVQTILQPRNFDILLYQLNIGGDPDVYAYWHSSQTSQQGLNFSNYSNIISDDALSSARARLDPQLRNAKYLTFARQWLLDAPAIGLYQSTIEYVTSYNTHSFNTNNRLVSLIDRYSDVHNWSVGTRNVYKTP